MRVFTARKAGQGSEAPAAPESCRRRKAQPGSLGEGFYCSRAPNPTGHAAGLPPRSGMWVQWEKREGLPGGARAALRRGSRKVMAMGGGSTAFRDQETMICVTRSHQ